MIPFWFLPYAIATGNTFILKPSERVPLCSGEDRGSSLQVNGICVRHCPTAFACSENPRTGFTRIWLWLLARFTGLGIELERRRVRMLKIKAAQH
jgi:hypothetical protein